jgi:hypothetical protein
MLDSPNSSQAVKLAGKKYKSLEQLHSSCIAKAAAKQPALAGLGSTAAEGSSSSSSSSSGSPYAADISSQVANSAARPNQVHAFPSVLGQQAHYPFDMAASCACALSMIMKPSAQDQALIAVFLPWSLCVLLLYRRRCLATAGLAVRGSCCW